MKYLDKNIQGLEFCLMPPTARRCRTMADRTPSFGHPKSQDSGPSTRKRLSVPRGNRDWRKLLILLHNLHHPLIITKQLDND